jgi:hypothetical protein
MYSCLTTGRFEHCQPCSNPRPAVRPPPFNLTNLRIVTAFSRRVEGLWQACLSAIDEDVTCGAK